MVMIFIFDCGTRQTSHMKRELFGARGGTTSPYISRNVLRSLVGGFKFYLKDDIDNAAQNKLT